MSNQTNDTDSHTTRVALYARVSTDLQARAEEGSLDTQVARLQWIGISKHLREVAPTRS